MTRLLSAWLPLRIWTLHWLMQWTFWSFVWWLAWWGSTNTTTQLVRALVAVVCVGLYLLWWMALSKVQCVSTLWCMSWFAVARLVVGAAVYRYATWRATTATDPPFTDATWWLQGAQDSNMWQGARIVAVLLLVLSALDWMVIVLVMCDRGPLMLWQPICRYDQMEDEDDNETDNDSEHQQHILCEQRFAVARMAFGCAWLAVMTCVASLLQQTQRPQHNDWHDMWHVAQWCGWLAFFATHALIAAVSMWWAWWTWRNQPRATCDLWLLTSHLVMLGMAMLAWCMQWWPSPAVAITAQVACVLLLIVHRFPPPLPITRVEAHHM